MTLGIEVEAGIRAGYARFIAACRAGEGYSLIPGAVASPYALCFAIFGWKLLRRDDVLAAHRASWDRQLRAGLDAVGNQRRAAGAALARDKAYLQLLAFTLSSLAILDTLRGDPLAAQVRALLPGDLARELGEAGVFAGRPRSGNHAMFMAILLCHARQYLGHDTTAQLGQWVELHRAARNRLGFWGPSHGMTHLQFQNGYHQHEMVEYLGTPGWDWETPADAVASLADANGQFAPYPGGGGCYDYDAVFMLTGSLAATGRHRRLLAQTAATLQREQNPDGGFCESHRIRPRTPDNWQAAWRHVARGRGPARWERLRHCLNLQRPKHDRVSNHWTEQSYGWDSSDLWNSWFRMLTLARIDSALEPARAGWWGFIDYPGIGYHHALRVGH